jgi:hypothetical protein
MSLFEEIFGTSFFSHTGAPNRETAAPPEKRIAMDAQILDGKPRICTIEGRLYRVTVEEIDTSKLKTKKRDESTSAS